MVVVVTVVVVTQTAAVVPTKKVGQVDGRGAFFSTGVFVTHKLVVVNSPRRVA